MIKDNRRAQIIRAIDRQRQEAQKELRATINQWASHFSAHTDAENLRRFISVFDIDVIAACHLNTADTLKLNARIVETMK